MKRYNWSHHGMETRPNGEYVRWEDARALLRRVEQAEARALELESAPPRRARKKREEEGSP